MGYNLKNKNLHVHKVQQSHVWRFYVEESLDTINKDIFLSPEIAHMSAHVLRLREQSIVELINGRGFLAQATLLQDKKNWIAKIIKTQQDKKNYWRMQLVVGMPKKLATLEEVLQIATELGADNIFFFCSEQGGQNYTIKNERLKKITEESLRVSKGVWQPSIFFLQDLYEISAHIDDEQLYGCFLCDESPLLTESAVEQQSHPHLLQRLQLIDKKLSYRKDTTLIDSALKTDVTVTLFIGPEASFSMAEKQFLRQKLPCQSVSLGPLILRVPMAVNYALSVTSAYFMS